MAQTVFERSDGTVIWSFLREHQIPYSPADFPFLTSHKRPRIKQVFSFKKYLELHSKGEALAYLYRGLGRALKYVGPVLDLEREFGFNDHTDRHTLWVAQTTVELLQRAGRAFDDRGPFDTTTELLAVLVGMIHDLGNLQSRTEHSEYSVRLLQALFVETQSDAHTQRAWSSVLHAVQFHEEPVLAANNRALAAGEPLQWALVAADKMHVGRDRIGPRSFEAGVKHGAFEHDVHTFINALVVRSTWYLGQQAFVWHTDFSVDQLEEKFAAFTKGELHRLWVPGFVQRLFTQQGQRYRDTFAALFTETYKDRLAMAAESVFLLFPYVQEFRVRMVDNDTRGKVGTGEMVMWQKKR